MTEVRLDAVRIPLDWEELFGRPGPVHVDLGSGKGRFLLQLAAARPELNLLGVERASKYYHMVCDRAARRGVETVRMLHTTGEDFLFRLVAESSVDAFYVLFPDPWPKKRHHKRRFVTHSNVERIAWALRPGGRLLVKTDHPDYAEVIAEVLAGVPGLRALDSALFEELPITGFEHKYRIEGRPIWSHVLERPATDS